MAQLDAQTRPLSLQLDSPPSASPFPSPSSSFLPPPMPGAHEFAVKPPPRRRSAVSTTDEPVSEQLRLDTTSSSSSRRQSNSISSPTILNSPSLASSRPAPLSPAPSRRVSTISTRSSNISRSNSRRETKRLSTLSMGGTNVTRKGGDGDGVLITPTAASHHHHHRQSNPNASSTPSSSSQNQNQIPTTSSTTTTTSSPTKPTPHRRRPTSTKIKIRDFAYPSTDDRYRGIGSDVPKPNQFSRLNKKLGGPKKARPTSERWSLSSSGDDDDEKTIKKKKKKSKGRGKRKKKTINGWDVSDDEDEEDDDDDDDDTSDDEDNEDEEEEEEEGWFKKGMGRLSWSFGFPGFKKQVQDSSSSSSSYPSRGEMDLNFNNTSIEDETLSSESSEYYDAPEAKDQFDEQEGEEEPLYPGLYRALYPFEPEGTAEMRLVEDQIVRVVGRGGGVGWAVVVVPDGVDGGVVVTPVDDDDDTDGGGEKETIRHALVPESYLELVQLD